MRPVVGFSNPAIILSAVVFPQPLGEQGHLFAGLHSQVQLLNRVYVATLRMPEYLAYSFELNALSHFLTPSYQRIWATAEYSLMPARRMIHLRMPMVMKTIAMTSMEKPAA